MIPEAGAHGDDAMRVATALGIDVDDVVDLAQTLNPVAADATVVLQKHLATVAHYPDPTVATDALARAMDVDPACLVLTNGGAEAIALIAQELGTGWVEEPDFSLYARHLPVLESTAGRWRSNPHNPTGRLAPAAERAAVWDEAFWPITTGSWTRGDTEAGAVVVGSLTKLLACPGLRIGYVLAPDTAFADAVRIRQPRWAVNALATAALPDLLAPVDLVRTAGQVGELRAVFAHELRTRGLAVEEADAPWVLVRHPGLRDELARQAVLVRDCTSFGWPHVFRVATPRPEHLSRVVTAFDTILDPETTR